MNKEYKYTTTRDAWFKKLSEIEKDRITSGLTSITFLDVQAKGYVIQPFALVDGELCLTTERISNTHNGAVAFVEDKILYKVIKHANLADASDIKYIVKYINETPAKKIPVDEWIESHKDALEGPKDGPTGMYRDPKQQIQQTIDHGPILDHFFIAVMLRNGSGFSVETLITDGEYIYE